MTQNIKAWVLTLGTALAIAGSLYDFALHPEDFAWIVIAIVIGAAVIGIHAVWISFLRQK